MLIKKPEDIKSSEITPRELYLDRRRFLEGGAALALGLSTLPLTACDDGNVANNALTLTTPTAHADTIKFDGLTRIDMADGEELTPYESITTYNNFYEFGTDKEDPAKYAKDFNTRPWALAVEGECENPKTWDIDDILQQFPLEERVYRLRCVEAWSMVVPWVGFSLADLVKKAAPTSKAKYIRFETLVDPERMPGQITGIMRSGLDWPYVEGLRIDEAMNPLAMLAVGLYGEHMPGQNGAPIRLVVPWKYGFKSIKSIVKIQFVEEQPINTWNAQNAREYGFYSNVNPTVSHPRWSQAKERRVGEFYKRDTLPFNGYAEQVAALYTGMDLTKFI